MLNELTALKIQAGLLALAHDQLTGDAPPPGQVSLSLIAEYCGVSEGVIQYVQRLALAKILRGLIKADALPEQYQGKRAMIFAIVETRQEPAEAQAPLFRHSVPSGRGGRADGALQRLCNGCGGDRAPHMQAGTAQPHGIDA
ncbi:hypothetical protein [Haloferula sp. BvORR071]|uniref:hypothetical protein n=1 Tax=Haloferula sp. BvORR071 TaxID=1396141 RepID=UPI002240FF6D|nr:hypothetical protein [Haloferula sp. BvORR071]